MKEKPKAVIILSGGVDSTTLVYDLLDKKFYDLYPLSFDYKQKHRRELEAAKATCRKLSLPLKVAGLDILSDFAPSALTRSEIEVPYGHYKEESMKLTVVPNRNMVFLSLAISYAIGLGARYVFYGAHSGDHSIYPDCRVEFVQAMQEAAELCDWNRVEVSAPYLLESKGSIVKRGLKLKVDYSKTVTCYCNREKACGRCGSCTERIEAFKENKSVDPISYEISIDWKS